MEFRSVFILLAILLMSSKSTLAQVDHNGLPDHTPMMSEAWDVINQLMYKVEYKDKKADPIITPVFPDGLKAMEGEQVTLQGYLVPISSGREHQRFMLSVLPIAQCMFCGQGDIPPMVEVVLDDDPIQFTEVPLIVKGELYLNPGVGDGNADIQLHHAKARKRG